MNRPLLLQSAERPLDVPRIVSGKHLGHFILHLRERYRTGLLPVPARVSYYSPDASSVGRICFAPYKTVRLESVYKLRNVRTHTRELLSEFTKSQRAARGNEDP